MIGAVDIGGTKIGVAAVTGSGRVAAEYQLMTRDTAGPDDAVRRIAGLLRKCGYESGSRLDGIGVGCTGPVNPANGVVGDVELLPGWAGFGLAGELSRLTGLSAAVENDADAAALAEYEWGAGRGANRFIYVTVSTGIGAGVVLDGTLYRGTGGAHPELGHQSLDPAGPRCYCGALGCWESLASGPSMVGWVRTNASDDEQLPSELSAAEVCEMARSGNRLALRAVEREGFYLGLGLANLVTIFCPDVIALGGGVMQSHELFLDPAREMVRTRCGLVPSAETKIVPAVLGKNAGLLGAARVWQTRSQKSEREFIVT